MSRYPKHLRDQHAHKDEANIKRAIGPDTEPIDYDNRFIPSAGQLRGIPAIGRGVTGAIPGTSPHHTHR